MRKFRIEVGRFDIMQRAGQGDSSQVILRKLRARLWCPWCSGDGYTHAVDFRRAVQAIDRHLTIHADEIGGQSAADLVRSTVLVMLPDEDESQQFRHTPSPTCVL